ncbi:MAG: nuclear transport factor 2 family protein [Saprospiraceae bacterium]|nr:nuclear transport factor 2 family protein [Pyrinomonadaceae bacterium]
MKIFSIIFYLLFMSAVAASAQRTDNTIESRPPNTNQITNIEELIDRYFDSLNETDSKRRRVFTKQVWAEKGKFGTPYGEVEGHDAIDNLVAGVQKQFPNSRVRRTSRIDGFGKYLRWSFTLSQADGKPIIGGVDFGVIIDGKLQLVMGFFDFAPSP